MRFFLAYRSHLAWLIRAYLALAILLSLTPAPPRVHLQAQQMVETTHPLLCVHTRLIDEVYEWKIQRSLQLVREMGADTIVEFFPWAYAENERGVYNWTSFDRIVTHARNQGLQVIARMGLVPNWARPGVDGHDTTMNTLPEDGFDDFAAFVGVFAARYAGVVNRIIIWNEPNLSFEWGYQQVDAAAYARLLAAVYPVAHAANPNVVILAAPLAPTLEPQGSPNGLNDLLYLQQLYQAGAAAHFDALAMHTYGFTAPPEAEPGLETLNFRRAELLRAVMEEYDAADKPVYITESGWNDSTRWVYGVRPSQRSAYTLGAYGWAEAHWPWLDKLCLWVLRYPAPTRSYPDYFALVTPDFQLRPLYLTLQAFGRGWVRQEDSWLPAPVGG